MLKFGTFSVTFKYKGVLFREEYNLPYRTEEKVDPFSTLYQRAQLSIENDLGLLKHIKSTKHFNDRYESSKKLGIKTFGLEIVSINEIHNDLIIEEWED